jgi:hypothetical protein
VEHDAQVPLTEDQHAVGEFGSQSANEPFGETVRSGATGRNPNHLNAHIGQDRIKRRRELASSVSDQESELGDAIAQVHHEVADLLSGPSAAGMGGHAQQMYRSVGHLQDKEHIDPLERHRAVHMEEVASQ